MWIAEVSSFRSTAVQRKSNIWGGVEKLGSQGAMRSEEVLCRGEEGHLQVQEHVYCRSFLSSLNGCAQELQYLRGGSKSSRAGL
jgi:hypothetical protein